MEQRMLVGGEVDAERSVRAQDVTLVEPGVRGGGASGECVYRSVHVVPEDDGTRREMRDEAVEVGDGSLIVMQPVDERKIERCVDASAMECLGGIGRRRPGVHIHAVRESFIGDDRFAERARDE